MRIALLAALLLIVGYQLTVVRTAAGGGSRGGRQQRGRHHDHQQHSYRNQTTTATGTTDTFGRWLGVGEAQALLRREAPTGVDCCPSVVEMVEPEGGKNMDGMYVELYRDGQNRQRFYEVSCRPDVENKPCRFVERRLHNQSRCVQTFSYTYALVRDAAGTGGTPSARQFPGPPAAPGSWTMDYIEVRSGCSCVLHARARHRHKHRQQQTARTTTPRPP